MKHFTYGLLMLLPLLLLGPVGCGGDNKTSVPSKTPPPPKETPAPSNVQ